MPNIAQLHKHAYFDKKELTLQEVQSSCGVPVYLKYSGVSTYKGFYNETFIFRGLVDVHGNNCGEERILPERIDMYGKGGLNDKFVTKGSKTAVGFTPIGFNFNNINNLIGNIYICAGLADGIRIYQATGLPVVCGVSESNIDNLCREVMSVNSNVVLIAVGDNDQAGIVAVHSTNQSYVLPELEKDWSDIYQNEGMPSLIKQLANIKPALPRFPDRHYPHKLQRQILKNELDKNINKLSRCSTLKEGAELTYAILEKYEFRMPFEYDLPSLTKSLILAGKHTFNAINIKDLSSIISTRIAKRKRLSLSLTNFDARKVKKRHYLHELPGLPFLTDDDFSGVLLFRAEKGIGKTNLIGKPFVAAKQNLGLTLATCHRMSLTADLCNRLGLAHYQDETLIVNEILGLGTCIPSMAKDKFRDFVDNLDYLFCDEIAQVLDFLASKQCSTKNATNADVYYRLKQVVTSVKCIVGVDAELNDRVIEFIELCRPNEKFHVYDVNEKHQRKAPANFKAANTHTISKKQVRYIVGDKALSRGYGDMLARVREEQNLWVAVESSDRAQALGQFFKEQIGDDLKILVINAKTKGEKQQLAFLNNPDQESRKYQIIIHSPVISSGVSVEHKDKPHFHHTYFIGGGFSVAPSHASQMLARVRYVNEYTLLLLSNNKKESVKDHRSILIGREQASVLDGRYQDATEFDEFCAKVQQDEAASKADFINGLLWLLEEEGHCVKPFTTEIEDLEREIKAARDNAKDEYNQHLISAGNIDSSLAFELSKKSAKTWEETCKYHKHQIMTALNLTELTPYDINVWDDGRVMAKSRRYAACYHQIAFNEKEDIKHLSHRNFSKAKVWGYEYMFDGLDLTGEKRITQEQATQIVKRVIKKRYMLAELGLVPGKYAKYETLTSQGMDPFKMPAYPMREVANIFKMLGIEIFRKGNNYHNAIKINDYAIKVEQVSDLEEIYTQIDFSRLGGYLLNDKAGSAEIKHENWQITKNLVITLIDHVREPYTARKILDKECQRLGIDSSEGEVRALYQKIKQAGG
jgi:putative DNA primase/helicase